MATLETIDASSLVLAFLREGAATRAVNIRDRLVLGADSIIEAGDLSESLLRQAQDARDLDPTLESKALFITVQDAGDEQGQAPGIFDNYVILRIIDRRRSYRNIRRVKLALQQGVLGSLGQLLSSYGAALEVRYVGRTGHRYDPQFAVEHDALTFVVVVELPVY
jgi:hypothetical protein